MADFTSPESRSESTPSSGFVIPEMDLTIDASNTSCDDIKYLCTSSNISRLQPESDSNSSQSKPPLTSCQPFRICEGMYAKPCTRYRLDSPYGLSITQRDVDSTSNQRRHLDVEKAFKNVRIFRRPSKSVKILTFESTLIFQRFVIRRRNTSKKR